MQRSIVTWHSPVGKRPVRLYVNEPASLLESTIDYQHFDSFISHKGDDTEIAEEVGDILYENGLNAYLDLWNPEVDGDSPELEVHLREVIRETISLVAVVIEHTPTSWWVPFEVGVARETESQIATFLSVNELSRNVVDLPSYLMNWPIMTSDAELSAWATALLEWNRRGRLGGTILLEKAVQRVAAASGIERLVRSGKVRFV